LIAFVQLPEYSASNIKCHADCEVVPIGYLNYTTCNTVSVRYRTHR